MSLGVEVEAGSADDVPLLKETFLALHEHHRSTSRVPVTEPDDRAWQARMETYRSHFEQGRALLHLARRGGRLVGYAFTVLHAGSDDTFPLGTGYAELYTLAVVPDCRGIGLGTRLLDVVDEALRDLSIVNLTVAVMADNDAAIRLYRRRGLVPGELLMYRIPAARPAAELDNRSTEPA